MFSSLALTSIPHLSVVIWSPMPPVVAPVFAPAALGVQVPGTVTPMTDMPAAHWQPLIASHLTFVPPAAPLCITHMTNALGGAVVLGAQVPGELW